MNRVIIKNDILCTVYSCGEDGKVKSWSILNKRLKYEFNHGNNVEDIVIGRRGTPLAGRLLSINYEGCRISSSETGAEIKTIKYSCYSIAVDKAQTVIAVGTGYKVAFIETTNFTQIKEVFVNDYVYSLAFNKRNDRMVAVTKNGEIHSLKF